MKQESGLRRRQVGLWLKRLLLAVLDGGCVFAAYLATLTFRHGGVVPPDHWAAFLGAIPYIILIYLVVNALFRLYWTMWEHASIEELLNVIFAVSISSLLSYLLTFITGEWMPRSVYIAAGLILILMHGGLRLFLRVVRRLRGSSAFGRDKTPALIIGAGQAGAMIIGQMLDTPGIDVTPACIVDDDPTKKRTSIHGVRVMGSTEDIPALVKRYGVGQIIFAIPSLDPASRRRILEICTSTGCEMKIAPSVEAVLESKGDVRQLRDVDAGDLLGRPEVHLETETISDYLTGATVLVTGGGGSIGSELCRQIARFAPRKLVIFDIYENNAYELYVDLKRVYGDALDAEVVIGSVQDIPRLDETFGRFRPDVVFHAAAYKHVPLMEDNPIEAIRNNVHGTFNTAFAADKAGTRRFVLISTDKAVNPTNVMGATKYLCELIVQYMNQRSEHTDYVAVRFGNVLGSNGSVLPLFRRQIQMGGPVTVTHRDVKRYFMTIPEAAQLVVQAGSMAKQGQIFLLDMGEPVRIDDLARMYIRLSGYEPDVDIKIEYTGLRPGEKMFEELLQQDEECESGFPGILIGRTHALAADEIKRRVDHIRHMAETDPAHIRTHLAEVVPTYHGNGDGR